MTEVQYTPRQVSLCTLVMTSIGSLLYNRKILPRECEKNNEKKKNNTTRLVLPQSTHFKQ